MSSSGPPAGDGSEGKLPESVSSEDVIWNLRILDPHRGQPKKRCEIRTPLEKHEEPPHFRKLGILLVEEDTTPASSEERSPICPEDATPASPEDTTPPASPEDTSPICPICIHGRHWMSFCPYLHRVPDGVTKIGEGYVICCQVCGMDDNKCGHNMASATPIFCFVCRSRKHFSRDCSEF